MTFECVCGIGFDSQEKFATHVQLAHDRPDNDPTMVQSTIKLLNNSSSIEEPTKSKNLNLKCGVCDERHSNELSLDTHRLLNHCKVPKSNKCGVCRQTLSNLGL